MRLQNYINEDLEDFLKGTTEEIDEIWPTILKECKPILKVYKSVNNTAMNHVFYRGMKYKGAVTKGFSRIDRKPKDMVEESHKFLDDYFLKAFGWRARSECVSATSSTNQASYYGFLYAFFPIGDFKYIWSPDIDDIIDYMPSLNPADLNGQYLSELNNNITNLEYDVWLKNLKKNLTKKLGEWYTNKDIKSALIRKKEIMFKCGYFYGLYCNIKSLQDHIFELIEEL